MKPLTREWLEKAEADYNGAVALNRQRKQRLPDLVCFHCQQAAEKFLKALLQERGIVFTKTHDLPRLLSLAVPSQPALSAIQNPCIELTDYAVDFRYPGQRATSAEAKQAMAAVRKVRAVIRKEFVPAPGPKRRRAGP